MRTWKKRRIGPIGRRGVGRRTGAAAIDYMMILGVIMPLAGFAMWIGPEMMNAVYEMACTMISWPFM